MNRKPGRNEPCWCGSGKKYKKCHLNRASETHLPFGALVREMQTAWDQKKCLHPQAAPGVCDRIVSAHTIQRSRVLQRIADSSNHVRTFHPLKPDLSTGRLELRRVGWREASTFTGFCAKHDSAVFKPLEEADFAGSAEQCFLVGYRALCHEVYQKAGLIRSYPRMRDLVDRGLDPEYQRELQGFWANHNAGAEKGLEDCRKLKSVMDEQLLKRDYSGCSRTVIYFRGELCVASAGTVSPNRDMDGNILQILHDPGSAIEELPFGIVTTANGGAAVFSWQACDSAPNRFVQSLLAKGEQKLPGLLVQFIFAYIENTYFSDDWWNSLSRVDREHIESLAAIGDPYDATFNYSPSLTLVPWKITDIVVA
jgi:SEC-C motif